MARRSRTALPKYVSPARDRYGNVRLRFRKGMFSTYLKSNFPSSEFDAEYQAALRSERFEVGAIGKARTKPGSISALLVSYYQSPEFLGTAKSTQATYRGICERSIRGPYGELPLSGLSRKHVKSWLGKMSDRPAAANNLLRMLRILMRHAIEIEMIHRDPTDKVRGYSKKTAGFHTWTEQEIHQFEARYELGSMARLAMALMLYTGQRRGDAVKLGWKHVSGERISVRQEKTGTRLRIKMHPSLIEALATVPSDAETFIRTSYNKAYSAAGFGNWFREQCDEAGLSHCSSHGLRKAAARRLAEAGNSVNQIAAVTGHLSLKEVERYTREADQERMADAAIATMPISSKKSKLSNTTNLLDRTEPKVSE